MHELVPLLKGMGTLSKSHCGREKLCTDRKVNQLYRDYDPLEVVYTVPNDFRYGLTRAVALTKNKVYLADENKMIAFRYTTD